MSLSREEYDQIMEIYQERRARNDRAFRSKTAALYDAHPELLRFRDASREISAKRALAMARGNLAEAAALKEEALRLKAEREACLRALGLTEADFEPVYTCPDCRDRGYIGREKCHCFRDEERRLLYRDSRLGEVLAEENFDTLSTAFYDRRPGRNGRSQYDDMTAVIRRLKAFSERFPEDPASFLFYGPTGVGKTFLSNCIAKAVLDRGFSVLYYSSVSLFEKFSEVLSSHDNEAQAALTDRLLQSDLLIIDDLGTELLNNYTSGKFFQIVNERAIHHKSTVISTNLDLSTLKERYTERVASRILSNYEPLRLSGDDIRIRKALVKRS
jgi:DNA replication protein DnaC